MQPGDHRQVPDDFPWVPAAMGLRFDAARLPIPLQQFLHKAGTHPKELG